jgi:hypothetical protein
VLLAYQQNLEAAKRWPEKDDPAIQGRHALELPHGATWGRRGRIARSVHNFCFLRAQHAAMHAPGRTHLGRITLCWCRATS